MHTQSAIRIVIIGIMTLTLQLAVYAAEPPPDGEFNLSDIDGKIEIVGIEVIQMKEQGKTANDKPRFKRTGNHLKIHYAWDDRFKKELEKHNSDNEANTKNKLSIRLFRSEPNTETWTLVGNHDFKWENDPNADFKAKYDNKYIFNLEDKDSPDKIYKYRLSLAQGEDPILERTPLPSPTIKKKIKRFQPWEEIDDLSSRLRFGYETSEFDEGHIAPWFSLFLYTHPRTLREKYAKTKKVDTMLENDSVLVETKKKFFTKSLLIPDYFMEISRSQIPLSDDQGNTDVETGARIRGGLFWPLWRWNGKTSGLNALEDSHTYSEHFGPVIWGGFDRTPGDLELDDDDIDEHDLLYHYYYGLRLAQNPYRYIEFTLGDSEALHGSRYQIAGEIPLVYFEKYDSHIYFRMLWNGSKSDPDDDFASFGAYIDIPLGTLTKLKLFADDDE